jgi:hypothetical protein
VFIGNLKSRAIFCEMVPLLIYGIYYRQLNFKNALFWDVTPSASCNKRFFGGTHRLHHQGGKSRQLETLAIVGSYKATPRHIPEFGIYHSHRRENLISYIFEVQVGRKAPFRRSRIFSSDLRVWRMLLQSAKLTLHYTRDSLIMAVIGPSTSLIENIFQ